jgi:hypothetical protein
MARLIRNLAWLLAISLVLATLLRLGDQLNVFATPPNLPDAASIVDRILGSSAYRHAIWPVYAAWNLLFGLAFIAVVPLASLLVHALDPQDARLRATGMIFAAGGILGAVAEVALVGAVDVAVNQAYCDCGFKEQEVISQFWAQNLFEGATDWLAMVGLILVGIGVIWLGLIFAARMAGSMLPQLSYVAGAALIVSALLNRIDLPDPIGDVVAVATFGLIVPFWAWWLGRDTGSWAGAEMAPVGG